MHALNPLNAASLLSGLGSWATLGIFLVVFAETGLLIGFILPGDSLLLTAGLLCATGTVRLSLPWVLAATGAGALLGAQTGYWIGRRGGRGMLQRPRNRHVRQAVIRAEALLGWRGYGPALVAARFLPIVRTVIGPLSGMLGVPARTFLLWQSAGGLLWTTGTTLAGYTLGRTVPGISALTTPALALTALAFPLTLGATAVRTRIRTRRARARARATAPRGPEPLRDQVFVAVIYALIGAVLLAYALAPVTDDVGVPQTFGLMILLTPAMLAVIRLRAHRTRAGRDANRPPPSGS